MSNFVLVCLSLDFMSFDISVYSVYLKQYCHFRYENHRITRFFVYHAGSFISAFVVIARIHRERERERGREIRCYLQ